jgi:hypothetical protein
VSIRQISQSPAGTTDFTDLKEEVTRNARGLNTISISNYSGTGAPVVKVGSVFENNNATFLVETGDETPTGYAGISVSTTFYLYFDESATAFVFASTAPTWSDALQGYYNGNDRAFFSMYKDSGGTLYENKRLLMQQNNYEFSGDIKAAGDLDVTGDITTNSIYTDNVALKFKVITGTMAGISTISIAHGLTASKIRGLAPTTDGIREIDNFAVDGSNVFLTLNGTSTQTIYVIVFYID